MPPTKILFLLKSSDVYGNYSSTTSKSGLLNSARITAIQITKYLGVPTVAEICVDGNEVDKFVFQEKPSLCVIEALWVTPTKLRELVHLHPHVKFVVLLHSNVAFLANEGIAMDWIKKYEKIKNVTVGFNCLDAVRDFQDIQLPSIYLPNIYYDVSVDYGKQFPSKYSTINIGCFGALRPMKNQLIQAFAAISFARKWKLKLQFHINSTRPEQGGQTVLRNIRDLFDGYNDCSLVEHDWQDRPEFLKLVSTMDLGMQISFSETFNIVSADFVSQNVPIVVSHQIDWMPHESQVSMYNVQDMVGGMTHLVNHPSKVVIRNVDSLTAYNQRSITTWHQYLKNI